MKNLKNRSDEKLVNNEKDYLKWTSKPSYLSQKTFDNDLVAIPTAIPTSEVALTLNKPAYVGMCILDLNKILMYEYDYIKNEYGNNSRLLFTDSDSLIYEIKIFMKIFAKKRKYFILVIIQLSQKFMIIEKKLVVAKMKDEAIGIAVNNMLD